MNQADFTQALEQELRLQAVPFRRADLLDFVEAAWPLLADFPDVGFWAGEFIEAGRVGATV